MKHFKHKLRIENSVCLVVQAQRRIFLALMDKVEDYLGRMQQADVLEPIENTF